MSNWSNVAVYLKECNDFATEKMLDVQDIPAMDEAVTKGLAGLINDYGIDLNDEASVYALIVGWCIAYRYGCTVAMSAIHDPFGAQVYLRRHGPISGNIGLVARQIVRNLNIAIPDTGADE